jgi:Tfp pilus assembly protein PilV
MGGAKIKRRQGFSVIEAIVVIVVLAIALVPFGLAILNILTKNIAPQALATATALAEMELERVLALRFSAINDVAKASFASPFGAYQSEVLVDYVDAGDLNTAVIGPTNYKRIQIKVTNDIIPEAVSITTLATNY